MIVQGKDRQQNTSCCQAMICDEILSGRVSAQTYCRQVDLVAGRALSKLPIQSRYSCSTRTGHPRGEATPFRNRQVLQRHTVWASSARVLEHESKGAATLTAAHRHCLSFIYHFHSSGMLSFGRCPWHHDIPRSRQRPHSSSA